MSTYYVPSTHIDTGASAVGKTQKKIPVLKELEFYSGKQMKN